MPCSFQGCPAAKGWTVEEGRWTPRDTPCSAMPTLCHPHSSMGNNPTEGRGEVSVIPTELSPTPPGSPLEERRAQSIAATSTNSQPEALPAW